MVGHHPLSQSHHYSDWQAVKEWFRLRTMRLARVLGINVRKYRKERGLSQEALADEVRLAVTYVGQIERGSRNPTLDVVERFAKALRVKPLDLLQ
jgi:ribosome-binding protein aMBF1 (putative translation factor)